VQRHFKATNIDQLWVADMTYIPTWVGFLYLAVVIDIFSRKVVGWSFGETMTANLVIRALNMALTTRKPGKVIHHSDQGSQYTSVEFGKRCKEMGVRPSMGSACRATAATPEASIETGVLVAVPMTTGG
jgi:putative transposase